MQSSGGLPKPLPVPLPKPEIVEDWSDEDDGDDDDDIIAQQRAEFAKLFGASLQSLVDSKADEEFFNKVDKYVLTPFVFLVVVGQPF